MSRFDTFLERRARAPVLYPEQTPVHKIEQVYLRTRGALGLEFDTYHFFARSNTAHGCVTFLNEHHKQTDDWRIVLIKSGFGGASSALMRTVMESCQSAGEKTSPEWDAPGRERICALRLPERKLLLADAEHPFAADVRLPGAREELFSLDLCRDNAQLRAKREKIHSLHCAWLESINRASRFLRAAKAMKRDIGFAAKDSTDFSKMEHFASRMAHKHLPPPNGCIGEETKRFLTSVSGHGLLLRRSAIPDLCPHIVTMEDDYGIAAPVVWGLMRAYAIGNGLDVIVCPCLLDPFGSPEHLLIPTIGLACITANKRHPIDFDHAQHVQASRFYQKEDLRSHKCRIAFCRRSMRELLAEAYASQAQAEDAKRELDVVYAQATDFACVERMGKKLIDHG